LNEENRWAKQDTAPDNGGSGRRSAPGIIEQEGVGLHVAGEDGRIEGRRW
jgi:hypothetical protein